MPSCISRLILIKANGKHLFPGLLFLNAFSYRFKEAFFRITIIAAILAAEIPHSTHQIHDRLLSPVFGISSRGSSDGGGVSDGNGVAEGDGVPDGDGVAEGDGVADVSSNVAVIE